MCTGNGEALLSASESESEHVSLLPDYVRTDLVLTVARRMIRERQWSEFWSIVKNTSFTGDQQVSFFSAAPSLCEHMLVCFGVGPFAPGDVR